eukprot:Skav233217  [mRNA]  locus=scaffold4182:2084:2296:+ [translate_table: standard]
MANLPEASEKPSKNESRGQVIQTVDKPHGWKKMQYLTQKGRKYWKWLAPNGSYYFSKVMAEASGFQDDED